MFTGNRSKRLSDTCVHASSYMVSVPNPPKICKKKIPGLKMITDVCIQLKNVDLKNASGCVYVSFKVFVQI